MTVPTELLAIAEAHEASYIRKIESLTAENERLREALERIAEGPGPNIGQGGYWRWDIAQKALKGV